MQVDLVVVGYDDSLLEDDKDSFGYDQNVRKLVSNGLLGGPGSDFGSDKTKKNSEKSTSF